MTAGVENELQVAVAGAADQVDLPRQIRASSYFANVVRRVAAGDTSPAAIHEIECYLLENSEEIWENSWVRFPRQALSPLALRVWHDDLRADRTDPDSPLRADADRFVERQGGEELVRIPVSYLLKLALADAVCPTGLPGKVVHRTGVGALEYFLSDNTSPETVSFHVCGFSPATGNGRALARETLRRYLLTQVLLAYANTKLGLATRGQRAFAFFSPHPPVRQRRLNDCISDAFYRELFMSPCLSGWDRGEDKQRYMELCHQVLSRSQLNAVMKLREAGIITQDLVVLPNPSNVSLANNGTHISLGSRSLSGRLADPSDPFGPAHEKCLADLVVKVFEHFLPLFVGTCSAAPYRLAFADFHPERVLGFLPHELDYTHLRMLWRRWQSKARNRVLGSTVTPFGPRLLDHALSRALRLKGDLVADFRLIDYPVALLSTPSHAALDGQLDNDQRLTRDLGEMGVFDQRMSLYLPLRPRLHARSGFSGFEGRYYSLFPSLMNDLALAADLQVLLTQLAFRYIAEGRCTPEMIPDAPVLESERRQIFFCAAIGIPTFYVRKDTANRFLLELVQATSGVRSSNRYRGYWRVPQREYRQTLMARLRADAADLVEMMGMDALLTELEQRLAAPEETSAAGRLTHGILQVLGTRDAYQVPAEEFNQAAERYYRLDLRRQHIAEGFRELAAELGALARLSSWREPLGRILGVTDLPSMLQSTEQRLVAETLRGEEARSLIHLILLTEARDAGQAIEA